MIAGVDEVGYGALVGDVVAAAVILPAEHGIKGIKDSKQLTALKREELFEKICAKAVAWHIAAATHIEIDQINILNASHLAMQRAIAGLQIKPSKILVDGNKCPEFPYPAEAIINGDAIIEQISAASILAKVFRDRQMVELDHAYPGYGFAKHKGYSTAEHMAAINSLGPIKQHRRSYAPVALALRRRQGAIVI
jgi:ribonuclease HII